MKSWKTAIEKTVQQEIGVDDVDGSLAFELRLNSGLLLIGELNINGVLRVNVYNDNEPNPDASIDEIWVSHIPQSSVTDFVALL